MENHSPSGRETEAFRQTRTRLTNLREITSWLSNSWRETRFYVINSSPVSNISFYIDSIDRSHLHSRNSEIFRCRVVFRKYRASSIELRGIERVEKSRTKRRKEERKKERENKNKRVSLVENDSIIEIGRGGKSSASDFIKA